MASKGWAVVGEFMGSLSRDIVLYGEWAVRGEFMGSLSGDIVAYGGWAVIGEPRSLLTGMVQYMVEAMTEHTCMQCMGNNECKCWCGLLDA